MLGQFRRKIKRRHHEFIGLLAKNDLPYEGAGVNPDYRFSLTPPNKAIVALVSGALLATVFYPALAQSSFAQGENNTASQDPVLSNIFYNNSDPVIKDAVADLNANDTYYTYKPDERLGEKQLIDKGAQLEPIEDGPFLRLGNILYAVPAVSAEYEISPSILYTDGGQRLVPGVKKIGMHNDYVLTGAYYPESDVSGYEHGISMAKKMSESLKKSGLEQGFFIAASTGSSVDGGPQATKISLERLSYWDIVADKNGDPLDNFTERYGHSSKGFKIDFERGIVVPVITAETPHKLTGRGALVSFEDYERGIRVAWRGEAGEISLHGIDGLHLIADNKFESQFVDYLKRLKKPK